MKKLRKLKISEMQDYVAIEAQKQMNMKGGNFRYIPISPLVWELTKRLQTLIYGSNSSPSTASCACPTGSTYIYESDSTKLGDGTLIYGSKVICIPPN